LNENTLLFPAMFDKKKDQWRLVYDSAENMNADSLTFVTFNIWFGDYYFEERVGALTEILKKSNADIIALQEITDASLQLILKEDWIKRSYYISDISSSSFYSYGVILLSRIPIKKLNLYPLISVMDRHVLIAEFEINEQKLLVGTTHLESLRYSSKMRAFQLEQIFTILNESDHAVLMGDFNFCSSWEENANIDGRYSDFWEILRPDEPGYTEDTDMNTMRRQLKREEKKVRFDRIISHSISGCWEPKKINRIGMKPISSEHPDIFPSDHFGLIGKLEWC
jgi:tyrosyl-DNA phosphodiesterase 2